MKVRPKTKKPGKADNTPLTLGGFMAKALATKQVPNAEHLATMVRHAFPETGFTASHVPWYASRYRKGLLPGQNKTKRYTIDWLTPPRRGRKPGSKNRPKPEAQVPKRIKIKKPKAA